MSLCFLYGKITFFMKEKDKILIPFCRIKTQALQYFLIYGWINFKLTEINRK